MKLHRIGRMLGIHHRMISDLVKAYAESLPETPMPKEVKTAELGELFAFTGNKKAEST